MWRMAKFVAVLLSLSGITSAAATQSFSQLHPDGSSKPLATTGGAVLSNGKIGAGSGFTVTRKSKGDYFLTFKKGSFAGLPVVTCTPFGEVAPPPICVNWTTAWAAGQKTFVEIRLYSTVTGNLQDGDFEFTEFTTSTTD